ncbi:MULTISPECIES: acetate--CoA ligase family protein [Streptomyces]|uniref:Acetate--CoA ligase family protein n=2 Tax=Streptomyces TaxID=1883 RepID=A0ABV9J7Y8_9ACTN
MLTYDAADRRSAIDRLLRPGSIAVLGASATRIAGGNEAIRNLRRAGFEGSLHVVHPAGGVVEGIKAHRTVAELPEGVDVALLNIPASALVPALTELENRGVAGAVVATAGLTTAEAASLRQFCANARIVVNGPNCMGVLNVADHVPMWFYEGMLTDVAAGHAALVTQSGSASFLARAAEGVGFSFIISSGNEMGASTADYLDWLADDTQTKAIGVVMESIRDVRAFEAAVGRCRLAGKPLVVLKVGRTDAGSQASVAHTGAIVGRDDAYVALFRRLDVPLVSDYDELAVALSHLASPGGLLAAGLRAAVVTDSGGEAALAADVAARLGVDFPQFEERTVRALAELLPGMQPRNPLDVGGSPGAAEDVYQQVMPIVAADANVDSIVLLVEALASMSDEETTYAAGMYEAARALAEAETGKPVVIASPTSASVSTKVQQMAGPRVPVLRGLANAVTTLRVLAANQQPALSDVERPAGLPGPDVVEALRREVSTHSGPLPVTVCRRLLTAYGIPVVNSVLVRDAAEAQQWADGRYPVVVKVASADVSHRSEVGGVVTGVEAAEQLAAAFKSIESSVTSLVPHAVIDGYEVQELVRDADEVLVGFVRDPALGPTVTVGAGGILVELIEDVSLGLAPLAPGEASELLNRTRLGRLLAGYRRQDGATDTRALVDLIERSAWLAADLADVLAEGDFNPVMVERGSGRVLVVDALIVASTKTEEQ